MRAAWENVLNAQSLKRDGRPGADLTNDIDVPRTTLTYGRPKPHQCQAGHARTRTGYPMALRSPVPSFFRPLSGRGRLER